MAVANRREIKEVIHKANLPYHMVRGSDIHVQPSNVTPSGDQTVVLYDAAGDPLLILTPNLDAQDPFAFDVTAGDQEAQPANPNRRALTLVNISDTRIFLAFDGKPAVVDNGIALNASGGTITLSRWGPLFTTGAVNAIHGGAGNKVMTIQEFI